MNRTVFQRGPKQATTQTNSAIVTGDADDAPQKQVKSLFSTIASNAKKRQRSGIVVPKTTTRDESSASHQKETANNDFGADVKFAATLSTKRISPGSSLLAVIAECSDADVTLHLPNGHKAVVDAANISDVVLQRYRDALAQLRSKPDDDDDIAAASDDENAPTPAVNDLPILSDFVRVDSMVLCVVLPPTGSRGIQVSLLASRVNEGLSRTNLNVGMSLAGCVRSIEDRGYDIDLGLVDNSRAFLPRSDSDPEYRVGEPLLLFVSSVPAGRAPVQLSIAPTSKLVVEESFTLRSLRAGLLAPARVLHTLPNGAALGFAGFVVGTVESTHTPNDANLRIDQAVKARILFVDPVSKRIGMSLLPHILKCKSAAKIISKDALELSSVVSASIIDKIKDIGAILRIDDHPHRLCFVPQHNLADAGVDTTDSSFEIGSEHQVRLLSESRLDGSLAGVMRASAIANPIALITDVHAGMAVTAVIQKVLPQRLEVKLSDNVFGIVPLRYMADVVPRDPSTRFKVGQVLQCRVKQVELGRRRIVLNAKPSMVESSLPIITTFEDAAAGTLSHGTVSRVWPDRGVFVEFYGGIGGFVPLRELSVVPARSAAQVCTDGQVVRCRVLAQRESDKRITLTLLTLDESRSTRSSNSGLKAFNGSAGAFVDGVVTQSTADSAYVRLMVPGSESPDETVVGVLNRAHTADVAQGEHMPPVGTHLSDLLVLRVDNARVMVSQKPLLVEAARAGSFMTNITEAKVGSVLVGYVTGIKPFGVFVAFGDQLSGLAPSFELQDDGRRTPEELFKVGQTVRAYVRNVSTNAAHSSSLQLSLRPSLCGTAPGTFLGVLLDARALNTAPISLRSGDVVKASVLSRGRDGSLKLQLPDNVVGTASAAQVCDDRKAVIDDQERMADDEDIARIGDKVTCIVLDCDPRARTAVVSLRASLLAAASSKKSKKALPQAGATVAAVVEAVGEQFCVVSLPSLPGVFAYASAQDYNYRLAPSVKVGEQVEGAVATVGSRTVLQLPLPVPRSANGQRQRPTGERSTLDLKPGTLVDGDIISSGDRYVGVSLGGGMRGRLYMTEVSDDVDDVSPLSKLAVGQTCRFKVLYLDETDAKVKNLVQLTMRPSELARGDAPPILASASTIKVGQLLTVRVRLVNPLEHSVLVVLSPAQKALVDFLDCGVPPALVNSARFRVGTGMRCAVLSTDGEFPRLAISSASATLAVGAVVNARVLAVDGSSLRVQLPRAQIGFIPNAPVLTIGQYAECKVTGLKSGQPVTLALVDEASALSAAKNGEVERVAQGTLDALEVGDLVDAVVVRTDEAGVHLLVADSIDAFSPFREAADDRVSEELLSAAFASGATVRARILSLDRSAAKATVALKRSSVSGTRFLRFEDVKPGMLVHGRINGVVDYGLFVSLDYSDKLSGLCHVRNVSDTERLTAEQLRERFERGQAMNFVVTHVSEADRKIALALKSSVLSAALEKARKSGETIVDDEVDNNFVAHDDSDDEEDDSDDVEEDVDSVNAKRARHVADDDDDNNIASTTTKSKVGQVSIKDLDAMLARTSSVFDDNERSRLMEPSKSGAARSSTVGVSFDDIDADVAATTSSKKRAVPVATADDDDDADGDASDDGDDNEPKGKRARNMQAASLRREEQVLVRERELADGTAAVLSETDHERAVTLEPLSARAWIAFMSFHAANGGIEAAREVSSRALKMIPMSKESIRMDVWLALLALELNFGDAASLDAAFKRAVRQNDAESVYTRMATLYDNAGRSEDASNVLITATKKFPESLSVWTALGRQQASHGDAEGFHATLQRAIATLTAHDQLTVIGRFARLEYEFGSVERGRTLFEGIVANHPQRIDHWNVYADMEIKFGDVESARRVYERLASQQLSSKKMRAALKQWLKFEQARGSEADAERVRQKAREYVQSQAETEAAKQEQSTSSSKKKKKPEEKREEKRLSEQKRK